MKIFTIIQCSHLGGMEKAALESLSVLKEMGHDVQLFSLHPVGELASLAAEKNIPLSGTRGYRFMGFGNLFQVLRLVRRHKPDRIWLIGHNLGMLFCGRLVRCPLYMSIHYHHGERAFSFWRFFYSLAEKCCAGIHFVSRFIHDEVGSLLGSSVPVVCFQNVLKAPTAPMAMAEARRRLELPDDAFVVGNAGWLIPRKAFDVFLQIAALVHREIPGSIFLIAGDGPERKNLEKLSHTLGLAENVRFLGWLKDLEPFYGALDVLLFNSNFDCLGMTPLEALARETPVVCSLTNGGLDEVLRHGVDGFLIGHHDCEALAAEIVRLHRDVRGRNAVARTGKAHVLEVCSVERHRKNLSEFLDLS